MADDYQDGQYDSEGGEFEKPKDEFLFYNRAFKLEEKKFLSHPRFEDVTSKYWQLLTNDYDYDQQAAYINQKLYTKDEMSSEIAQEWLMDSNGNQEGLNFQQLTKVLFRIAHQWAVNIDIDEYLALLESIYNRIHQKRDLVPYMHEPAEIVIKVHHVVLQEIIQVKFPADEKKISEQGGKIEKGQTNDDWLECRSDESNKSDYEYRYEEDPENMTVKKYKKQKNDYGSLGNPNNSGTSIKEAFIFTEEVEFRTNSTGVYVDYLLKPKNVKPLGFYAEQFVSFLKNSVYSSLQQSREANKQEIERLKREMREQNKEVDLSKYAVDVDEQMMEEGEDNSVIQVWEESEQAIEQADLTANTSNYMYFTKQAYLSPKLYNHFRKLLKDASHLSLRVLQEFPKPGSRQKPRSQLTQGEPLVEINKFGYNPALERRLFYKLSPLHSQAYNYGSTEINLKNLRYQNVYYLEYSELMDALYRSDVQRVETKGKMALKDSEELKKEEEFVNVETSFQKLRQIMLYKKFGTIYQDRCQSDNKEQKRLKKVVEREDKRINGIQKNAPLAQKGVSETYEDKNIIKMMKGPFYQLESAEGLRTDAFGMSCFDLIQAANTPPYRILILGKPRSGKTTFAKNLAKKLDLVHINVENWIQSLLLKIKNYEPPELEEGQEAPKWLTDLEEAVQEYLLQGKGPNEEMIDLILKKQICSPEANTQGYILDLPFQPRSKTWNTTIRQNRLLSLENVEIENFTHIIDLVVDDDDIRLRASQMKVDPKDGVVYSKWEIEERKKPKIVPEGEEEVEEIPEDEQIKPLDESSLVQRICDTEDKLKEELTYYNTIERQSFEELIVNLYDNQFIRIDSAGLTPEELIQIAVSRITPDQDLPLRAKAVIIENGSDFKSLLTEGLEENQIPRQWSFWKLCDPVALANGKVVQGTAEFAASYYNHVFVFSSEENMKAFVKEPKIYINQAPMMPTIFRTLIIGPKGSGRHTQAIKLSEYYGWRIIDYKELIRTRIDSMRAVEVHIPNNPMPGGRIGLSEQEMQDIVEGKAFPLWKFIPWIFDELGFELEKKKPPPPEPKDEEEKVEEEEITPEELKKRKAAEDKKKKEEEEKKRKEEEEIQRQKEDRRRRRQEAIEQGLDLVELGLENEDEEIIIIEDIPIDQLGLKVDEESQKAPFVGGFILLGFPETEDQFNKLKEAGIEFDKVIYLADTYEEEPAEAPEPGAEIKLRMKDEELYDYDQEKEFSEKILNFLKEQLGEDIVKEISCNGSQEEVFIRIRREIDPFCFRVDNPDDNRTSADLGEEDKKLPKGQFGEYCPVTFQDDGWLIRGTSEFEVLVQNKSFWCAGEKEAKAFKFNPQVYCSGDQPLRPPPPKIMVLGQKGSGVSTQIRMLCDKFKLEEFNLKDEFLKKLAEEKEIRKRRRRLDRGFKPPPPEDEIQEGVEEDPDPEDFDKVAHERDVMRQILDSKKGLVIDATWTDLPEDTVASPLEELLFESRRLPEIVIMLKCKEKSLMTRPTIKSKLDNIQNEFDLLMEERAKQRQLKREEDRIAKQQELSQDEEKTAEEKEEEMKKWDEDRDVQDEADDENDPEKPNLQDMREKYLEDLRARREKDDGFMETFGVAMKEKSVFVIDDIKADVSAEYVFIKLQDKMKDHFQFRSDMIERMLAQPLKAEEIKFFEKSYIYRHSKLGLNSPIQMSNPIKTKKHTVLYRDRLYFLTDEQQQQQFLREPSKFVGDELTIPLDVMIRPKVFVLGHSKVGKSTLCKALAEKLGVVHLKMTKIIQMFLEKDCLQCEQLRKTLQKEGKSLDDETLVTFLLKRIQYDDCYTKGFILEDFPKTRTQAVMLAKRGLVPTNVFNMRLTISSISDRKSQRPETKFGFIQEIFTQRVMTINTQLPGLLSFYRKYYNNVCDIDMSKSKWFVYDRAFKDIQQVMEARQQFARSYHLKEFQEVGCKMRNMRMDRFLVKQSLSDFRYFCPVTWRNEKQLHHCVENFEDCVLYKHAFYYFKSSKERDLFISNPERFLINSNFPSKEDLPLRLKHHKAAEILLFEKALNAYCPVSLMDEERVIKGDTILLIHFRESKFVFMSEYKLRKFFSNPFKYSKATLPVKMPPNEDKISLYNLSKMDDSITFMEQALGQIVTRALREVSENRLKYPTLSVKETMLKLFALFLKTNNPANTEFMKKKYQAKMKEFISKCELPEEIFDLSKEKEKKKSVQGGWAQFKENQYNDLGSQYDQIIGGVEQEKYENFMNYIR